ncbi:MAG: helix-turn-helix domain-containing protein [Synergistaceae bacterium]|nr:helix-turn-helix domain-containing protein [Synergistaceae bacterium]
MDINEYLSVEDASKILNYRKESISLLCRQGKLEGVKRIGHQWFIPRKSVENYEKAPQGFAAIWKRRREAEKKEAEKYDLENENDLSGTENESENEKNLEKKNVNLEILRCLKILIKEVRKLERTIAQTRKN